MTDFISDINIFIFILLFGVMLLSATDDIHSLANKKMAFYSPLIIARKQRGEKTATNKKFNVKFYSDDDPVNSAESHIYLKNGDVGGVVATGVTLVAFPANLNYYNKTEQIELSLGGSNQLKIDEIFEDTLPDYYNLHTEEMPAYDGKRLKVTFDKHELRLDTMETKEGERMLCFFENTHWLRTTETMIAGPGWEFNCTSGSLKILEPGKEVTIYLNGTAEGKERPFDMLALLRRINLNQWQQVHIENAEYFDWMTIDGTLNVLSPNNTIAYINKKLNAKITVQFMHDRTSIHYFTDVALNNPKDASAAMDLWRSEKHITSRCGTVRSKIVPASSKPAVLIVYGYTKHDIYYHAVYGRKTFSSDQRIEMALNEVYAKIEEEKNIEF